MLVIKNNQWMNIPFTDPENHNEEQFIYLVHAIQTNPFAIMLQEKSNSLEGVSQKSENINLLKNPYNIANKKIISCSLIGNGQINGSNFCVPTSYSNVGLILKVPCENIIYCDKEDIGSEYLEPDEFIKKYSLKEDIGPISLLIDTDMDCWNEVVVLGSTEFGSALPIGVFLNCFEGELYDEDVEMAINLSNKLGKKITKIFMDRSRLNVISK